MRPVGDRILLKQDEAQAEKKVGAIFLPGDTEAPARGTVAEVGADVKEVKVFDRIYFSPYAGAKIDVDGEEWLILRETDVLLVA